MAHVIVIGGSGMLADACLGLCAEGYTVSVAGRSAARLAALMRRLKEKEHLLNPVAVDYADTDELVKALREAIGRFGPPLMVIAWIHSHAQGAHARVAALAGDNALDYFHVRGSTDPRTLAEPTPVQKEMEALKNVSYFQVALGFVVEDSGARWLTNEEISRGVLEAVKSRTTPFIVGTLEPFSARP